MSDLAKLQQRVVAFRDAREWKQFHNPKDMALSLVLEAAEVLEHFQWKSPEEMEEYIISNKQDIADELIDVLYWVLVMAHDFDIDLNQAFETKMAQNEAKYDVKKSKGNHKKYTEL